MNAESNEERSEAPMVMPTRRGFIKAIAAGSVAAAAVVSVLVPDAEASHRPPRPVPRPHPGTVKVFRFRTRDTVSCKACRIHHRYKVFRTRKVARKHRAHPGCDCPIEPQWMPRKDFRALFKPAGLPARQAVDLRKI